MYTEHEAARKRKLEAGSSDPGAETDEQLARRLHEELNALTRHSRRGAAQQAVGPSQPRKPGRIGSSQDEKPSSKQQRLADASKQASATSIKQEAADGQQQPAGSDREGGTRKRCMLSRELAMLVVDMVESHVKPVTGARSKLKGEQQDEHQCTAVKHESSSSLSEQERLAIEQLHAAGADGKLVNKLLSGSHLIARTSDSGAAGDSCTTGATSSGKGSGNEQEQQQSSLQQKQQQPPQQLHGSGTVNATATAPTRAATAAAAAASTADCAGSRPIKIPKLPMVLYGKKWYRAKVLKDAGNKVMLDFQGYSHEGGPFWLNKDHARIWRGSYKGKDWRYLGDGAWEPKVPMTQEPKARSRCKAHRKQHSAAGTASDATGAEDSDAEPQQQQQQPRRRAAAAAVTATSSGAAEGAATSERDTASADQQGGAEECLDEEQQQSQQQQEPEDQLQEQPGPAKQQEGESLTMDSPSVPESAGQVTMVVQPEAEQQTPQQAVKQRQQQELQEQLQQEEQKQQQGPELLEQQRVQVVLAEAEPKQVQQVVQQEDSVKLDVEPQCQSETKQQSGKGQRQQQSEAKTKQSSRQLQQTRQSQQQPKAQSQHDKEQQQDSKAQQDNKLQQDSKVQQDSKAQQDGKPQSMRRRRQSETDASDSAGPKAAAQDSPSIKQGRRPSARAAEKAAERAAAAAAAAEKAAAAERAAAAEKAAAEKAAEAAAAAAPAAPADSSSERPSGAVAAAPRGKVERVVEQAAEEVASPAAKVTGRGGRIRGVRMNSVSKNAAAADQQPANGKRSGRGGRSKSAAATAAHADSGKAQDQPQEQQQQQQQPSVDNPPLQVDASKPLKHSSSSEGMPLSPTSPGANGSPKATGHRRKGKPQRARLDSDDLQQPAKKIKLGSNSSKSNGFAFAYSNSDAADILDMSFEQAPPQPQPESVHKQQEQQPQVHLGWKGGWKGAYKKGMWQQGKDAQHKHKEHKEQFTAQPPKGQCVAQQQLQQRREDDAIMQQHEQHWGEQQQIHPGAAPVAAGEGHMQSEQVPVIGGSDPEDFEAACVLVGASMGRAHSAEVYSAFDMHQQSYQHQQQLRYGSDEQPVSPRSQFAAMGHANSRQNGRRRGHNWSKPLNRPPRPPPMQQQGLGRRHSVNGSLQYSLYAANGDMCNLPGQSVSQDDSYAAAAAAAAPVASPRFSRQGSLPANSSAAVCQPVAPQRQPQIQHKNGSHLLPSSAADTKQATLRQLLDAVGEVQASSGRPDLMYPLQYGGVPAANDTAKSASVQLPHIQVSAAAAALLAAVPSLETLQHMASVRGQSGLVTCLSGGGSLSLFQ